MYDGIPSDTERCAWYALLLAIVKGCTSDQAIAVMEGHAPPTFYKARLTPEQKQERRNAQRLAYKRNRQRREADI